MPDGDETIFTVTDLKQYMYCPRILYFHSCLPDIRPITYKMQAGINAHETEHQRASRRTLGIANIEDATRHFDLSIESLEMGLSGQIDEVIEFDGKVIPVDYKLAHKAGFHFKIQLAAYTLLLEEYFDKHIEFGYLYLIPLRKSIRIKITSRLRHAAKHAIGEMHKIVESEHMPSPTDWRQRCIDCEFRRYCNDV